MLAEERFTRILRQLEKRQSVTVGELCRLLDASESTVRRDLTILHNQGKLVKVFGGATTPGGGYTLRDDTVAQRQDRNREEKELIARYAASLLEENDFVYLDAGTSTALLFGCLPESLPSGVTFVTNSPAHACRLSRQGRAVFVLGGELKPATEAAVGTVALRELERYNFTKGFFGANGIHPRRGVTTPDVEEAMVKSADLGRCRRAYILADSSKFGLICPGTICGFSAAVILTTSAAGESYRKYDHVWEAEEK